MGRGAAAPLGAQRWSNNGYLYTKIEGGWILESRRLMQEKLGRKLESNERVTFDNNNKRDVRIDNLTLGVVKSAKKSLERRRASIVDRIRELEAELLEVEEEIAKQDGDL